MEELWRGEYESPVGRVVMVGGASGLRGAWFEGQKYFMRGVAGEVQTGIRPAALRPAGSAELWSCSQSEREVTRLSPRLAALQPEPVTAWPGCEALRLAREWLEEYFAGQTPSVQVPLDPQGTEFQKLVWRLLLEIPYGETTTYGELAKQAAALLHKPTMSAQAIGGAVGRNPISLMIPCHRVLGSHGELTGYAGGVERKRWLLEHERYNLR